MADEGKKKKGKGLLSAIWESMTKTGGCCGPGETCGGPPASDSSPSAPKEESTPPDEVSGEK